MVLALQIIFTLPVASFTIFSDSLSVLSALRSCVSSVPPLVLSALEWLYLLGNRGYRLGFCWVPGHVGVTGNERADVLAREAAARAVVPCPVPYRDVLPAIRVAVLARWQDRWDALRVTSKMGEITTGVSRPWSYVAVRDRRHQTVLVRLRIGHTRLTHGYLMSGNHQPFCDDCLVPLSVRHLLVECPSLVGLRNRYLSRCRGANGVYDIRRMLGPDCLSPGFDVIPFLREAGFLRSL